MLKTKTRRALTAIWLFGTDTVSTKRLAKLAACRLVSASGSITLKGRRVMRRGI